MNRDYALRLTAAVENGWRPDLERLEQLTGVEQMQKADYQEAWAWVHYLLHDSPETRTVLLDYIHELRTSDQPPKLKDRLSREVPQFSERLLLHASTLPKGMPAAASREGLPH
jgi:hypothetical protein